MQSELIGYSLKDEEFKQILFEIRSAYEEAIMKGMYTFQYDIPKFQEKDEYPEFEVVETKLI